MLQRIVKKTFSTQQKYQNNLEFLFANHIKQKLPYFAIRSGNIEVLKEPIDFYIALHRGIRTSGERICLSALYLGTGNLEKFLILTLENKLKKSKKLRVNLLMDYHRGTRLDSQGESSLTLLSPLRLSNRHNQNLRISFFQNPDVNKIIAVQAQGGLREVFGVHHIKAYVFDNNVIISGANLQESYFTERQDRYILFKNCPEFADYVDDMIQTISGCSYQVEENGDLAVPVDKVSPSNSKEFKKTLQHQFKMFLYSKKIQVKDQDFMDFFKLREEDETKKTNPKSPPTGSQSSENEGKSKQAQEEDADKKVINNFSILNRQDELEKIFKKDEIYLQKLTETKERAQRILKTSFSDVEVSQIVKRLEDTIYAKPENTEMVDMGGYVYLFPSSNIPQIKYHKDKELFASILDYNCKVPENQIKLTTGYMNLIPELINPIVNSKAKVDLLTASPMANGFFNAGFFKKWIPVFYRAYEYLLQRKIKSDNIRIHEFAKGQWTFHSKGIWVYEKNDEHPSFASIGGGNFSDRSYHRDTEFNIYMYTYCPKFKEELHMEVLRHYNHSQDVTQKDLKKDPELKFGFMAVLFAKIFSRFL